MTPDSTTTRRAGVTAVHSLDHFVFSVPDLDLAARFYDDFGLEVQRRDDRLHLHTFGHSHRWGTVLRAGATKRLQYLAFGAFADDVRALEQAARAARREIGGRASAGGDLGPLVQRPGGRAASTCSPRRRCRPRRSRSPRRRRRWRPARARRRRARRRRKVHPRRLSHVLLFTSDVARSQKFYADTLGLRLSDHSGDGIAFMHGAHASDHHMLAFAKSDGPGLHHSSWDVASIDEVGLGMEQMTAKGHTYGWGVGRHVVGSNYFHYARDPWGSFAEYSHDIDFIRADVEWRAKDHPPEDAFYVWGPPPPDYFIQNHETASEAKPPSARSRSIERSAGRRMA